MLCASASPALSPPVKSSKLTPPVQQAEEQKVDGVETKAVVLRKALRAMNIEGSVRVDERTGMVSNIDVIKMLCPENNDD